MIHVCVGKWSSKEKGTTLILVRRLMNEWNRIKKLTYGILMLNNNVDKIALKGKYKSWITSQLTILLTRTRKTPWGQKKNPLRTRKNPLRTRQTPLSKKETPLARERDEYREGHVYIQHNWNKETNFKMNN